MKQNLLICLFTLTVFLISNLPSPAQDNSQSSKSTKSTKATITFDQADKNKDGVISKEEVDSIEDQNAPIVKFFWDIDKNEDRSLTRDEFNYWTKVEGNRYPGLLLMKIEF